MKKTLLITILFVAMFTTTRAQSDTTTYWYSPSHADWYRQLDGCMFWGDGSIVRCTTSLAPNGKQYTTMCDCTTNPAPNFPDAEMVCMTVDGIVVDPKNTSNEITKMGNIIIFEKPVSVDTISVPVLCEAYLHGKLKTINGNSYLSDDAYLGVEIIEKRQEITVKRILQPTNVWEINKGHHEELRESFAEVKHWIDNVEGCYQLTPLQND